MYMYVSHRTFKFCYFPSAAFKKIKRAVRFICTSQSVTRINPGTSRGGGWGRGGGQMDTP